MIIAANLTRDDVENCLRALDDVRYYNQDDPQEEDAGDAYDRAISWLQGLLNVIAASDTEQAAKLQKVNESLSLALEQNKQLKAKNTQLNRKLKSISTAIDGIN